MPAYPYYGQNFGSQSGFLYQPVQTQTNGIIWVSGLQEAQMYPIAPNNAVALWQKDGKTIYLKSADATGRPSLKVYDLSERSETPSEAFSSQESNLSTYATKSELGQVLDVVGGINEVLSRLKEEVEAMKSFDVPIKKKTVKKEVVEDE